MQYTGCPIQIDPRYGKVHIKPVYQTILYYNFVQKNKIKLHVFSIHPLNLPTLYHVLFQTTKLFPKTLFPINSFKNAILTCIAFHLLLSDFEILKNLYLHTFTRCSLVFLDNLVHNSCSDELLYSSKIWITGHTVHPTDRDQH